jgi:hypothetical protein
MAESEPQPDEDPVDPIDKLRRFEDAWAAMEYMESDQFGSHDGESVVPQEPSPDMPEVDEEDREAPSPFVFRFDVSAERGVTEPPPLAPKAWADRQASPESQANYWQAKRDTIKSQSASKVNRRIVASAQEWADNQAASPIADMPEVAETRGPGGETRPPFMRGLDPGPGRLDDNPMANPANAGRVQSHQPQGPPFMRGLDPGPGRLDDNPMANPANSGRVPGHQPQTTKFIVEPGTAPTGQPFTATETATQEQHIDLDSTVSDFGNEMIRFASSVSWSLKSINAQLSEITRAIQAEGGDYQ